METDPYIKEFSIKLKWHHNLKGKDRLSDRWKTKWNPHLIYM